ncbi:hypothetical protein K0M31_011621 [Melipona bicolor]|uniref:Uncharacterized protein n=1 Tax=Melipona bicolor TaxID=60889 RepID=A0AA40KV70_9HYME|nr:hypothetical protein K0M31_011621 [Melipona bicolor]
MGQIVLTNGATGLERKAKMRKFLRRKSPKNPDSKDPEKFQGSQNPTNPIKDSEKSQNIRKISAVLRKLLRDLGKPCIQKRKIKFQRRIPENSDSYGVVLGTGAGLVRETAGLVLGHYFRKRREFVEMVVQAGAGVGIVLFSVFYREAVG